MLNLILVVLPAIVVGFMIARGVIIFQKAQGTMLERLLSTSKDSLVWFNSKVLLVGGWIIVGADNLAQLVGQDDVGDFVRNNLPPQWAGWGLVSIAVVMWVSRFRILIGR